MFRNFVFLAALVGFSSLSVSAPNQPLNQYLQGSWRVGNVQCPSPTGTWRFETWTFERPGALFIQIPGIQTRGSYKILGPRLLSIVPPQSLVGSYTSNVSIVNQNHFVWTWEGMTTAGYRVCDIQFKRVN